VISSAVAQWCAVFRSEAITRPSVPVTPLGGFLASPTPRLIVPDPPKPKVSLTVLPRDAERGEGHGRVCLKISETPCCTIAFGWAHPKPPAAGEADARGFSSSLRSAALPWTTWWRGWPDADHAEYRTVDAFGWPCRALARIKDSRYRVLPDNGSAKEQEQTSWEVPLKRLSGRDFCGRTFVDPRFPICPLWRGMLVDAVLYGAAFYVVVLLPLRGLLWIVLPSARGRRRLRRGECPKCRYELRGLPAGAPCPECGWKRPGSGASVVVQEHKGSGV
jgi:hypothetical protein